MEFLLLSLHSSVVCVSSDSLGVGEPAVGGGGGGVFHSTPIRFCPGDDLMKNADRCVRDGQPRSRILRSVGLLLPPRRISLFSRGRLPLSLHPPCQDQICFGNILLYFIRGFPNTYNLGNWHMPPPSPTSCYLCFSASVREQTWELFACCMADQTNSSHLICTSKQSTMLLCGK